MRRIHSSSSSTALKANASHQYEFDGFAKDYVAFETPADLVVVVPADLHTLLSASITFST